MPNTDNDKVKAILAQVYGLLSSTPAKGVYAGAGVGAGFSLLRAAALEKERKKILRPDPTHSTKDQIVLRLPYNDSTAKLAEATAELCDSKPRLDGSGTRHVRVAAAARGKYKRGPKPRCEEKHAQFNLFETRPYRRAFDVLKYFAGAGAGFSAVKHVYNKAVAKQLDKDEEYARTQFIGAVGGAKHSKLAADLNALLPSALTKSAQTANHPFKNFDILDHMALLTLLGVGGSALVTKNVLDTRADSLDSASYRRPPPIRRIVLRRDPPPDKKKKDDELDKQGEACVLSPRDTQLAVVIKMAELTGEADTLVTPSVVKLAQANSAEGLWGSIRAGLSGAAERYPDAVNEMILNAVRRWPALKRLGFSESFSNKANDLFARGAGHVLNIPKIGDMLRSRAVNSSVNNAQSKLEAAFPKQAFSFPVGVLASYFGSEAAKDKAEKQPEAAPDITDAAVDKRLANIDIVNEAGGSEGGTIDKQDRLQAALKHLVEQGLI